MFAPNPRKRTTDTRRRTKGGGRKAADGRRRTEGGGRKAADGRRWKEGGGHIALIGSKREFINLLIFGGIFFDFGSI